MKFLLSFLFLCFLIFQQNEAQLRSRKSSKILSRECNYCHISHQNTYCRYSNKTGAGGSCGRVMFRQVEEERRQEIVDAHNELRGRTARGEEPRLQGITASNMMELVWDEELARGAQLWADQCVWEHDSNDICRFRVGQNLYQSAQFKQSSLETKITPDWSNACEEWYEEVKDFHGDPTQHGGNYLRVGHWSQLIWATTEFVGCGYIVFDGAGGLGGYETQYYVCNYGPGGNYLGEPIYRGGETCSRCPSGTHCTKQGLCSRNQDFASSSTVTTQSTIMSLPEHSDDEDDEESLLDVLIDEFPWLIAPTDHEEDPEEADDSIHHHQPQPQCSLKYLESYLQNCSKFN